MSLILAVYSRDSFKEYHLPSINNSDYELVIRKEQLSIEKDITISMEVVDNLWTVKGSEEYRLYVNNQRYDTVDLSDGLIVDLLTSREENLSIVIEDAASSFRVFDKYRMSGNADISFGKSSSNDVVFDFKGISREHATITRRGNTAYIRCDSPNGIYINSRRVDGESELSFGDYINIIGLHLVYLGSVLAIDTQNPGVRVEERSLKKISGPPAKKSGMTEGRKVSTGKIIYSRAPRHAENLVNTKIEIEGPPQMPEEKEQSLFLTIGPSITMALPMLLGCMLMIYSYSGASGPAGRGSSNLFMYSGLVMAVSSALIGVMWTLINRRQQKKDQENLKALRMSRYSDYLIKKTSEIKEEYERTINGLFENYPEASKCIEFDEYSGELWGRNVSHDDFLVHRIGIGDVKFPMEISTPPQRFSLYDDDLAERPEIIKSEYDILYDVPVTIDMYRHNLIGVVGDGDRSNAVQIAKNLSAQIAANNCYTDVKLVYIYDGDKTTHSGEWDFTRWLPHVWSEDKKTRFVASNRDEAADVLYELGNVFRVRAENENKDEKSKFPKPYYVLFVANVDMIEGELFSKYIFESDKNYGLTSVILADHYEALPNKCEFIIENSAAFKGFYESSSRTGEETKIAFDSVDAADLEDFARRLARLQVTEVESGGDIPSSLTFFEMMGIRRPEDIPVRELWTKSRIYDNIRGLIGQKAGGAPMYLDVHEKYHGPHGLIAGTTGSGKSETLQTYILSLAINYSPDDIAFFIIDYKGGGMANLFDGLPHMAGQISNLSGNQVKRAMISIKSENRRRQRIFTDNGVNNINSYTKLFKTGEATIPVPHLFIIIDEFAELKREEPEFMRELISVAQVGRSLGVHLILATQKPSGTVDDNIWSNSRFRLCLRVQDRQDSNDMLHKPDAAYITQAGRCYLQVGNDELYELFQSGYSGAAYDVDNYSGNADIARLISLNGKTEMTGNSIRQKKKKNAELSWVEQLTGHMRKAAAAVLADNDGEMLDPDNITKITTVLYKLMADAGIDYPVNKYNSDRLHDLVAVYSELSSEGDEPDAADIVALANQSGKKLPQQKDHTELDAVKEYISRVGAQAGYTESHQLWLPVLRDNIIIDEFEEFSVRSFSKHGAWKPKDSMLDLEVVVGQMDDPENQNQMTFTLDFAEDGNLAICGSVVSGKSTALQTITYSLIQHYSPEEVNVYALDFSSKVMSAFETAPHTGGIMYENDNEKIEKFFNMINGILEERKRIFHGGNYRQYVRVNGITMPAIFIMIDNYGAFKQKTDEKYEEDIMRLSKEGISNGIFLVVTGGGFSSGEITTRIGENFSTVLTLSLKDRFEYGELLHNMQVNVMPEPGVKGRGLAYYGSRILEYQTAIALAADNDYERIEKIRDICDTMSAEWKGRRARPVPVIPEKPLWDEFTALDEYRDVSAMPDRLPVGYDSADASVYGIPLADTFCYVIYGEMHTGKTNMLKACILAAADKKAGVYIFDSPERQLGMFDGAEGIGYCSSDEDIAEWFKGMTPEFMKRRARKDELISQDRDPEEVFKVMSTEFDPIFVFISGLDQFSKTIHESGLGLEGAFENVFEKGRGNGIYFFADLSLRNESEAKGIRAIDLFIGHKKGIHLGGNTGNNTSLDLSHVPFDERYKAGRAGTGDLPDVIDEKDTAKVVIPLVKKAKKDKTE